MTTKMTTCIKVPFQQVIKLLKTHFHLQNYLFQLPIEIEEKEILEDLKKDYPFICLIEHVGVHEGANAASVLGAIGLIKLAYVGTVAEDRLNERRRG